MGGRIDLDGCAIGGDLEARNLRVVPRSDGGRPQLEVDADNAVIRGSVDLATHASEQAASHDQTQGRPVPPELYANFDNAEIFGDFRASGAVFAALDGGSTSAPGQCLDLRGAQIRGDLCLDHIRARGLIRLEDADIAQDLELGGARLCNPKGVVVDAPGVVVHGSIHLVDRTRAERPSDPDAYRGGERDPRLLALGQLRFARARVGGDFDASGATVCAVDVTIEGVAIDLRSAEFGGSVYLDARRDVGPGFFVGLVNMIQARVGGSIVFSGSWFRAPCGQMMGPERIDAELYSETEMRLDLANRGVDPDSTLYRNFSVEDVYYGYEHGFWDDALSAPRALAGHIGLHAPVATARMRERTTGAQSPAHALLKKLKILQGLRYSARGLWRLRGGCRAIALEDAKVAGAVLFGTSIDIHPVGETDPVGQADSNPAHEGARHLANGPSVVVGCVDMDRITVDGELRLTGGIFRAVTPIVAADDDGDQSDASPTDDNPDPSLSYPSTVGWTELKARSCLTLRGARIAGRLDTRFFGAIADTAEENSGVEVSSLKRWRDRLKLVPEAGPAGDHPEQSIVPHHDPRNYADEMLFMIALAGWVEAQGDRRLGATHPHVPPVQEQLGGYHLRPDGRFDLRDAYIRAIHDHPCHGWPTSDGHVQLNGCQYDFMQLEHDESRLHPRTTQPAAERPHTDETTGPATENAAAVNGAKTADENRRYQTLTFEERYNLSRRQWYGRGVVAFLWRGANRVHLLWLVVLLIATGAYWKRSAQWPPVVRGLAESPAQRRHRQRLQLCMAIRASRYQRYAQRSFWARNNDRCPPHRRRVAWLEQQYHGADPTPHDFLPQPYENLCRVMRANGYREDADKVAAAKRRQRSRATIGNPVTLMGEHFLRWTSDYGYAPARVVWFIALVIAVGAASLQVAVEKNLLAFESLQTEGVAVFNSVQDAGRVPGEDLTLDPLLLAVDGFIPLVEVGYASEWSIAEWYDGNDSEEPVGEPLAGSGAVPDWGGAVYSFMEIELCMDFTSIQSFFEGLGDLLTELFRAPVALAAWLIGFLVAAGQTFFTWGHEGLGLTPATWLDEIREVWTGTNPENTLRWLGAIYHGLGWALISMAIVTFTGVMRRD
jgi:hypothetical protein